MTKEERALRDAQEKRMEELFDELVPMSGKADSLAGEIIRAVMRIEYRRWNDGDHIGVGYGKETCNPAARFLQKKASPEIGAIVTAMWGVKNDSAYDRLVGVLIGLTVDYIDSNPQLRELPTDDMWEYKNRKEDVDDSDWWDCDDDYDDEAC